MIEKFEQRIREMVKEAYEQGRKDGEAKSRLASVGQVKSAQEIRDHIVAEAKADTAVLVENAESPYVVKDSGSYVYQQMTNVVSFVVNREKRTVVALVRSKRNPKELRAKGIAKCDPKDCFNEHIGKAIALRRALEKDVPERYLHAPQPTDFRVGDLVSRPSWSGRTKEVIEGDSLTDAFSNIRIKTVQSPIVGDFYVADDSNR